MQELQRRMSSAAAWGVEPVSIVTPAEIKQLVPFIDESVIVGGFYSPGVGVVDSLRAGTIMRERAQEAGALTVSPLTEVLGIDVEHGRVRRVRTTRGDIDADVGRHRLRRLEPAHRPDGRGDDPADAGGAPDDRRRAGAALRRLEVAHRVPDRARHGHEHVRAPGRERARDRLVRPPRDPARPRGDPLDRAGVALADRAAVHAGRLRPADGGRARADARDRRRRERGREVRDQRPPLADARRSPAPGRDARGEGPLVVRRGVGEGGAGDRRGRRRVDDPRRVRDRPALLRHRPLLGSPEDAGPRQGARGRGLQQDVRHRPPGRAVGVEPRRPPASVPRPRARARRRLLRGRRLGAAAVVRVERAARSRSTATG